MFRSDANSRAHGLLPQAANWNNKDAVPIGISKTTVATPIKGWPAGEYAGLTCAACHEAQLSYKGKQIRIEGGASTTVNLQGLIRSLDEALQATLNDPAKFERLAARMGASSADAKANLRKRMEPDAARVHQYATRTSVTVSPWGPGRMDALTMIADRVTATLPEIPENSSTGNAPVKPPFLWNAPQGLWTQWAAFQQDPIHRNFGETEGVYLPIDLTSKTPAEGLFDSNGAILDLQRVENLLSRLAPPSWPEDLFGKIDRDKAKAGKALFTEYCASVTMPGPIAGLSPTSTASASSWSEPRRNIRRHRSHAARGLEALRPHWPTCQVSSWRVPGQTDYSNQGLSCLASRRGSQEGNRQAQAERRASCESPRLSGVTIAADSRTGLQGGSARRGVGDAAIHAQRVSPKHVRDADSGQGPHEKVLSWTRIRSRQSWVGYDSEFRWLSDGYHAARQLECWSFLRGWSAR